VKSFVRRSSLALGALLLLGCEPDPTTGTIVLTVSGLPAGALADLRVSGPNDYDETVPGSTTLEDLPPGEYHVSINAVTHSNGYYTAPLSQQTLTVSAGNTESATIAYALTGGSIDLSISGLPTGIPPQVRLLGPLGFSRMVLTSGIQTGLPAGAYTIRADTLGAADGDRYGTGTHLQQVTVTASLSPATASVAYGVVSGTLNVVVEGLVIAPSAPPVTITGPGGFERTTTTSATYRGLTAGNYTITAASAGTCPAVYAPSQPSQTVTLPAASSVTGTVTYSAASNNAANLNLRIEGGYLVQVTQDYAGTVPMIAGKKALLRVFGNANQCNTAVPKVRVTLGDGTVYNNLSVGEGSTRLITDQGSLTASYNVEIPAEKVTSGLTWFAEIDPDNAYAEPNESDNRFPASGVRTPTMRTFAPTRLRFVPVTFSANNTTGNIVGAARVDSMMVLSRKLLPVHSFDIDIREPYTTPRPVLQANDQNGSWGQVLGELNAIQISEQSGRYYYGVLKVSYSSGVAGIGYVGGRTAMGWDYLPSGSDIMAHEIGHNFSASHTPCGGPGGVDQDYPTSSGYQGGYIGTYGYDFADNTVKTPQQYTDLMGYCNTQWISDFSYLKMLTWVTANGAVATLPSMRSQTEEPGLLVWGRIVNGEPVLEPAFEIDARTQIPAQGAHRVSAIGADGREIFSVSFDAQRIADLPGDHQSFAMVLPKSMLRGRELASLKLTTRGGKIATNVQSAVASTGDATLSRVGPRALRMRWDAARFPVVMVRNPQTGSILSFARGGDVTIVTDRDDVELNYSNRVRSIRELRRAP
jgi:hypothetical protein